MKLCIFACLILFIGGNYLQGKLSHLLVSSVGEGVVKVQKDSSEVISFSSFLPKSVKLSVRPKSGIETLAAGYQFRFGASSTFVLNDDWIKIFEGSLFVRSRSVKNALQINGPESSLKISGAGSCLLDVQPNGGFKCVGLLGKVRISNNHGNSITLLPGELVFTKVYQDNFSDKVVIDLSRLLNTSFLISGFSNSSSFLNALKSVAGSQKQVISKSYSAKIGDAKGLESFEILNEEKNSASPAKSTGYQLPESSPLNELLGRSPKRMDLTAQPDDLSSDQPEQSRDSSQRPFPSRLLRSQ